MIAPEPRARALTTVGYFAAFAALGASLAALGPALPALGDRTGSALSVLSAVFIARSAGYVAGTLAAGPMYDRLPGNRILAAVLFLMAAALMLIPLCATVGALVAVILAMGLAAGFVEVGSNTLLLWQRRARAAPYLNALHFSFGVGASLAPLGLALLLPRLGGLDLFFWAFALAILPVAAALALLPSPSPATRAPAAACIRFPYLLVALVALFFLLYGGIEHSYADWISTYAFARGYASTSRAAYLASAFWGALTLGRLVGIAVSARIGPALVVAGALAAGLLLVGVCLLVPHSMGLLWAVSAGLGLALAAIIPTTLALVGRRMPVTGLVTGLFFVGLGSGALFFPWLVGQWFESMGPQVLFVILGAGLLVAGVLFAGLNAVRLPVGIAGMHSDPPKPGASLGDGK